MTIGQIGFAQTTCNQTCNQNLTATNATKFPSLSSTSGWQNLTNNQRVRITFSYTITPIGQNPLMCSGCPNCSGTLMVHQKIRLQATIKCEAQMKSLIGNTWAQTSVFKPDFEIDFNNFFFNYQTNSLTNQGYIGDCSGSTNLTFSDKKYDNELNYFPKTQNFNQLQESGWTSHPYHTYRKSNINDDSIIFFDTEVYLTSNNWFSSLPKLTGTIACRVKKGNNWISMGNITP